MLASMPSILRIGALALLPLGDSLPLVELPEGPARAVVEAARATGADPAPLEARSWPASLDAAGWSEPGPWLAWAELVRSERDAPEPDPERRAGLALLAARQGRHADAWSHFEACAGEPSVALALLPHLFPGIPGELDPTGPLPDGVVLRPLLPPAPHSLRTGELVPARMEARELVVGDAVVTLSLELARDGVQIDVEHVSGGPATLTLFLPEPADYRIRVDYLDWERREEPGVPHEIELRPGLEPSSSWGRFAPRRRTTPGSAETLRLGPIASRGIAIEAAADRRGLAEGFAGALGALFELDARVGADSATGFSEPIVLRLGEGAAGLESLATWISWSERLALGE